MFESIFFLISCNSKKPIIVGVVYRPNTQPLANLDLFIEKILEIHEIILNENKIAYLMGDYNINLLNFGTHIKTNDFLDNVISQGFVPQIIKPTRITSASATLIYHIYCNHTHTNCDSGIIITDIADHFGVFHVAYEHMKVENHPTYIQVRQLKKENILKLKNDLATADYSSVFATQNPDDAYDIFLDIYTSLFEDACPLKQIRVKRKYIKREPWVTSGILTSSINKSKLLRKKLNKPNRQNIEMYKNYCRIFNALKRAAKANFYIDILNKHRNDIKKYMDCSATSHR